jgi:hypothetical protein
MSTEEPKRKRGASHSDAAHQDADAAAWAEAERQRDPLVLIDYNGVVAAPKGRREVRHTRTPLRAYLPINGAHTLTLQPGLNRILLSTWEPYAKQHTQIRQMIGRGRIAVLESLPLADHYRMESLVDRTYDHDMLRWIKTQVQAAGPAQQDLDYGSDQDHEQRARLIAQIDKRLNTTRPIVIESKPYREPAPVKPGQPPAEPSFGM